MRIRTKKEKEILGKVEVIFRQLNIYKGSPGYPILLDVTVYAYAFPEEGLEEIIDFLSKENCYLGFRDPEYQKLSPKEKMYAEMVHTVKSAIEGTDERYLEEIQLEGLNVILKGKRGKDLEEVLLSEIGEKYAQYSNDEKIVLFFVKRILKAVKNEA